MVNALILAKENRIMIDGVISNILEIKSDMKQAFNHMSNRLPLWATLLLTLLFSLVTGLIVVVLR